jgi:hypothetical protein
MNDLKTVLMTAHGMPEGHADELISEMHDRVMDGEDPEDVLSEIGLEPDYVFDLLW